MKRVMLMGILVFLMLMQTAWAGEPVGVSPSGVGVVAVSSGCPTFSWAEVSGATGYVVEVYEMVTSAVHARGAVSAPLVLRNEISAPAFSWTPPAGQCLTDGLSYVWYVGGVSAGGTIQWSAGSAFEVNLLADSQAVDAVKETVKNYLTTEWAKTESYALVKEEIKKEIKGEVEKSVKDKISIAGFEGASNTFYGQGAGNSTVGDNDFATFIGYGAGYSNTTGMFNTFIGNSAGYNNTTGAANVFIGRGAGYANTTGIDNVFMGNWAGGANTTGGSNTIVGSYAGRYNTTASGNAFFGRESGYSSTGANNTFLGNLTGRSNTTGWANTFVGNSAGYSNTTGEWNVFIGDSAGHGSTTGSYNAFVGLRAGRYNAGGIRNAFFGIEAGENNTGNYNTFLGNQAGRATTTGGFNTFVGSFAGGSGNTTGSGNVFIGYAAGYNAVGSNKLYIANSTTSTPLIYGDFSLGRIGIGMNNPQTKLDLGGGAITVNGNDVSAGTGSGQQRPQFGWTETGRAIMGWGGAGGANMEFYSRGHADRPGEYYIVYGGGPTMGKVLYAHYDGTAWNPALSMLHNGYVGFGTFTPAHPIHHANGARLTTGGVWTNASSRDYKDKIEELKANEAIEALKGLNPVKFIYKSSPDDRYVGFIAEDVPQLVATKDRKALSAMDIVAVVTSVVKEQQSEIEKLKAENLKYEERISKLEAQNKNLEADNQAIKAEFKEKMAYLERQLLLLNSIASK